MKRVAGLGILSLLLIGCEPMEVETESGELADASTSTAQAVVGPRAPAVDFASVDEALAALAEATDTKQSDRQKDIYNWLARQDAAAVPAVVGAMNNPSLSIETRRMACRALSQLGATAAAPLVEASQSDEPQLKLKAIEVMPAIEPQQKIVVDRLIELLDDSNDQVRRAAVRALGQIGPAAQRSADKLIALQNNTNMDEMTRDEAAMAIKRVQPRRTFID
jgi:HEAT repeat protein